MEVLKMLLTQLGVDVVSDQIQDIFAEVFSDATAEILAASGVDLNEINDALAREGINIENFSENDWLALAEVVAEEMESV